MIILKRVQDKKKAPLLFRVRLQYSVRLNGLLSGDLHHSAHASHSAHAAGHSATWHASTGIIVVITF